MSANDTQIGGSHYRKAAYQHWDFVPDHFHNRYMEGAITKYICRYRGKDGVEGLRKAAHFCTKLAELANQGRVLPMRDHVEGEFAAFNSALLSIAAIYDLTDREVRMIHDLRTWRIPEDLKRLRAQLTGLALELSSVGDATPAYVSQD